MKKELKIDSKKSSKSIENEPKIDSRRASPKSIEKGPKID